MPTGFIDMQEIWDSAFEGLEDILNEERDNEQTKTT